MQTQMNSTVSAQGKCNLGQQDGHCRFPAFTKRTKALHQERASATATTYLKCNTHSCTTVCCQVDEWQALLECQLSSSPEQGILARTKGANLGGDVICHSNDLQESNTNADCHYLCTMQGLTQHVDASTCQHQPSIWIQQRLCCSESVTSSTCC